MPNPFPNPDLRDFRFVSLLPSLCYGQNIMIATVDGQSGKPLQRITVPLYASDIELYPTADGIALQGEAKPPHTKPFNSPWHLASEVSACFCGLGLPLDHPLCEAANEDALRHTLLSNQELFPTTAIAIRELC